ncbi:efflux RND transporter periplasmic adaptor subunit [Patescibacteria group bacterium]|nr:efflux RND transporter periplasmic adaptor subunit [Patescibacteria group bacterium]MBU1682491.1 efflux RND transporter periplasmic adaptor subunit [Patescibacteria group bacterium]MBU1935277.1 efflux RND transporter periplasmic adaptor subunit [Patescibacteria group bacterium]
MPNKTYSLLAILLVPLFFLAGCGEGESENIAEKYIPQVQVLDLNEQPTYVVSEIGTIKPVQEIEIISEGAGTVDKLYATLGQSVKVGQLLGTIDYGTSVAQINLDSANIQLNNAQNNLDEVQANNQDTVDQAQIAVDSLETVLEQLERNLEELKETNASTLKSLELQLSSAETSLDSAEIADENTLTQIDDSWDTFYDGTTITLDQIFVNANLYYQFATGILNSENSDLISSTGLGSWLGARDSSQKNDTVNVYNQAEDIIDGAKGVYDDNLPLTPDNIKTVLNETEEMSEHLRDLMGELSTLLDNSVSNDYLPEEALMGYVTQSASYEVSAIADINAVNQMRQNLESLQSSEATLTSTAGNNVTIASNQLENAQNALDQFGITSASSVADLESQIEQTKNQLESARTNLASAERMRNVQDNTQESDIDTLENQVRLAQQGVNNNQITSSIAGVVSELNIDEGDYVAPGTLIGKVIQYQQVKVVFYVSDDIADTLSVNHPIKFTESGDEFSGVISKISPAVDLVNKKIRVEAIAANNKLDLTPDMFVDISIDVSEKIFDDDKIYIPLNALMIDQNEQFVFVADNGIAVQHDVEIGSIYDKWVEVVSGLSKANHLITDGHRNLVEGSEVSF